MGLERSGRSGARWESRVVTASVVVVWVVTRSESGGADDLEERRVLFEREREVEREIKS